MKKRGRKSYKELCTELQKIDKNLYYSLSFALNNLTKADFDAIVGNCFKNIDGKIVFYNYVKKKYTFKNNMFYFKDGYFVLKDSIFNLLKPYLEKNGVEIVCFIE